jgi:hypothetical protein
LFARIKPVAESDVGGALRESGEPKRKRIKVEVPGLDKALREVESGLGAGGAGGGARTRDPYLGNKGAGFQPEPQLEKRP